MFGPNDRATKMEHYTHRSRKFCDVYKELKEVFTEKFDLQDYEIVFVTGSGSMANEMVINSIHPFKGFNVVNAIGKFGERLDAQAVNSTPRQKTSTAYVHYETGLSEITTPLNKPQGITFSDMISAFPYFCCPKADIFTTVSSKQLGGLPVLGIVCVKKSVVQWFVRKQLWSILDLRLWIDYGRANQTPVTAAIPLYVDLLEQLKTFETAELIARVNRRWGMLSKAISEEYIVGYPPVMSIKQKAISDELAERYDLYKTDEFYQLFLWSGTDLEYEDFIKKVRC